MGIHLPAGAKGIIIDIRIRKQLGKKLLYCSKPYCKHKRLVAIITTAEITCLKGLCHGYLGQLFAVSKNAEFSLACKYFFTSYKAGFPANTGDLIVAKNL